MSLQLANGSSWPMMAEIWNSRLKDMESWLANPLGHGLKKPVLVRRVNIFLTSFGITTISGFPMSQFQ
jgi:hypothetical protein